MDAPSKIQPTHCVLYLFTFTENGKLYAQIHIGLTEKTIVIGEALGDDLWHSVKLERRGMVLSLGLDDDRPIIGKLFLRSQEFILGFCYWALGTDYSLYRVMAIGYRVIISNGSEFSHR